AVLLLCDLGGKTRKEAARHLRVPEGTVASRLTTARSMLAKRLSRHGLVTSSTALALLLTQQAASARVPLSVASTTISTVTVFSWDPPPAYAESRAAGESLWSSGTSDRCAPPRYAAAPG